MEVALLTVYSHDRCTLKDVAGGFGTVFEVGRSWPARLLERAKQGLAALPSPVLGTLAAAGRRAGHSVRPFDVRRRRAGHDALPDADLALVLSSLVDADAERDVLAELRARGTRTIVFGAHATARPERYAGAANAVVRGEPEALGARLFDDELAGIVDAGWVEDLDALPAPDWDGFPIERYRYALLARPGRTLPVAGSRGCAYGCGYCPFRVTAPFRVRRAERVLAEVEALASRWGTRAIAFRDPLFNFDRDRTRELARGLGRLGMRWSAEMRADRLDESLLEELHAGGLRSLEMGVESVDVGMLARERRAPPSRAHIERMIRVAHRLGVRVIANFVLGLPDDRADTIRKTVAWAKDLNTFAVQFTVATPYPGTTLEARVRGELVEARLDRHTGWEPVFTHPTLGRDELRALREWAYVSYHMRPRYLASLARQTVRALAD